MVGNSTNMPNWKQRLALEIKREKKKAVTLAILIVIAGIIGGRLFVKQLAPSKATAASGSSSHSAVSAGESSPSLAKNSLHTGTLLSAHVDALEQDERDRYIQQIDHTITRNIFVPNPNYFPPEQKPSSVKLMEEDDSTEAEELIRQQAVQTQARALLLQSTIISTAPTAIINGRVLRTGEWINGFELVEITSRTCVVKKDNVKVVLEMKN